MKILYYSTAYHAKHGGSIHAKAFVDYCRRNSMVSEIRVFPPQAQSAQSWQATQRKGVRNWIKRMPLLQVLAFFRRNRFYWNEIVTEIEEFRPDVLHIRLDSNFLQLAKFRRKFPWLILTTEVNASPFDESFRNIFSPGVFRRMEQKALSRSDLNFFVSSELRRRIMKERMTTARDHVVQNGVDIDLFSRSVPTASTEGFSIIYIGTLDEHKGIERLLTGFAGVVAKHPEVTLVVAGDGPDRQRLEGIARQQKLERHVKFTGWIAHTDVPRLLETASIAVHHKANPYMSAIKLFEYLAMKLPVVGPDIPSVTEVFTDGEHLLLTTGEPADIEEKLNRLISDKDLRDRIATNGERLVRQNYTWEHNVAYITSRMKDSVLQKARSL